MFLTSYETSTSSRFSVSGISPKRLTSTLYDIIYYYFHYYGITNPWQFDHEVVESSLSHGLDKISNNSQCCICREGSKFFLKSVKALFWTFFTSRKSAYEKVRPKKCVRKRVTFRPHESMYVKLPFSLRMPKNIFIFLLPFLTLR
jgi:hypothetical protein